VTNTTIAIRWQFLATARHLLLSSVLEKKNSPRYNTFDNHVSMNKGNHEPKTRRVNINIGNHVPKNETITLAETTMCLGSEIQVDWSWNRRRLPRPKSEQVTRLL